MHLKYIHMIGIPIGFLFVIALFTAGTAATNLRPKQQARKESHLSTNRDTAMLAATKPEISQKNIDIALKVFNITIPNNTNHPVLDFSLKDRGITQKTGWLTPLEVYIGPEAFTSWGILGSTLAHELEVHCQQSFTWINLLDLLGFRGTEIAERSAYLHEVTNARRFGLSEHEVNSITMTMDFFYPDSHEEQKEVLATKPSTY